MKQNRILLICWFLLFSLVVITETHAKQDVNIQQKIPGDTINNDKLSWWRDAKFEMFIHWGLYSEMAEYQGKKGLSY